MMTKKILCLLATLCLALPVFSSAEDAAPAPVTAEELDAFLAAVREQVLPQQTVNDPADENAQREDGTFFQYETVAVYAEGSTLTAGTPVNALVFSDSEGAVFRDIGIDTQWTDLAAAFPLDNKDLAGTREEALLYLRETDGGFLFGRILRDGQRITAAEYGEMLPAGEQYRCVSVTFTLHSGLVTAVRVDGLNPNTGLVDSARAKEELEALRALSEADEYRAVKSSRNGTELTAFSAEDLVFSGFSYTELRPDQLPGSPESDLIDNEDGSWLLRCDGDGYAAVFRCDEKGENAEILSFSILDDDMEGPRAVRLGDLFSEDFSRFRNGENEMAEDMTELLYGEAESASWGTASYDPYDTSLRYVAETPSGMRVELVLKYENNLLNEIILHTV